MKKVRNLNLTIAKLLGLVILLFSSQLSFSQSKLSEKEVIELIEIKNDISGTYQVQVINSRNLPTIPLKIYSQIKEIRDQNEVKYIKISEFVRILVLPANEINTTDFIPLEYINYIKISK